MRAREFGRIGVHNLGPHLIRVWHPADVERATHGVCGPATQRNWVNRRLVPCPFLEEPRAGKPREFPGLAVVELCILTEAAAFGLPLQLVSDCLKVLYVQLSTGQDHSRENCDKLARRYLEDAKRQRDSKFAELLAFRCGEVGEGDIEGFDFEPLVDQLGDYFNQAFSGGNCDLGLYKAVNRETRSEDGFVFAGFTSEKNLFSCYDPDYSGKYIAGSVSTTIDLKMIFNDIENAIDLFFIHHG
ncbi:MAG: hypothetical protein GC191_11510 [Azospirillum sp.]|nr:hypothetical protein [Azospirillum sp.]